MSTSQFAQNNFSNMTSIESVLAIYKKQFSAQKQNDQPNYTAFAFFMCFVYMTTFFSHADNPIPNLYSWLIGIKGIGALLCVGLLIEPYWPAWLKQRFVAYWYFTLFYCLPFAFTLLLLLNAYSIEWIVCLSLALTLLLVLVNWRSFFVLAAGGIVLAFVLYRIGLGPFPSLVADNLWLLLYSCTFPVFMGLIFVSRKEQSLNILKLQNQQLAADQQKNLQEIIGTLQYKKRLLEPFPAQLGEATDAGREKAEHVRQIIARETNLPLVMQAVPMKVLEQTIRLVYCLQSPQRPLLLFKQETKHQEFEADLDTLEQVLRNSFQYILRHNRETYPVLIAVEDATLDYNVMHIPNHPRTLEALRITITTANQLLPVQSIYQVDLAKSNMWIPKKEDEWPLVQNARIMDAHDGHMDVSNLGMHIYVIPVHMHMQDLRGKVKDLTH